MADPFGGLCCGQQCWSDTPKRPERADGDYFGAVFPDLPEMERTFLCGGDSVFLLSPVRT